MSKRIRMHLRSNVVGYVALFCFAISGTAAALPGTNTVDSADIVNGQVRNGDLGANAVRSGKIADQQVLTSDLGASAVTGDQVLDNALTGTDVAENTLGPVPAALRADLGGLGRGGPAQDTCNPAGVGFATCATVGLTVPGTTRALVLGRVRAVREGGDDSAAGHCRLGEGIVGPISSTDELIALFQDHEQDVYTLVGVSPLLGPGTHSFGIDCNETAPSIDYTDASVVAVALSPG
jgi:hypothetical protein